MRAVVLVGGRGTRLQPLTDTIPKPMLPIGHRPMIERLLNNLEAAGVTEATLALGFRPEPFIEAFPDGRCGGVALNYAVEPEPLDTAGAIAFAARFAGIDDTFVVANGDVISDLDIAALVERHRNFGARGTIHLTPVVDPSAFGVVELDPDGRVLAFIEKPGPAETDSNLINAGTYVLEASVLDLIPEQVRVSVERDVFPVLTTAGQLFGWATDRYWLDSGRPEFYIAANLDLLSGIRPDFPAGLIAAVEPGADVESAVVIDRALVSAGARLCGDAVVRSSVILPGAVIETGAVVEDSIVMGHVGAGARLERCVVGAGGVVAPHTVETDGRFAG